MGYFSGQMAHKERFTELLYNLYLESTLYVKLYEAYQTDSIILRWELQLETAVYWLE